MNRLFKVEQVDKVGRLLCRSSASRSRCSRAAGPGWRRASWTGCCAESWATCSEVSSWRWWSRMVSTAGLFRADAQNRLRMGRAGWCGCSQTFFLATLFAGLVGRIYATKKGRSWVIIPTVSPHLLTLQFIHLSWSVRISFMVCITILFLTASIFLIYFHLKFSFTIFTISKIGKISNCHNFQNWQNFQWKMWPRNCQKK